MQKSNTSSLPPKSMALQILVAKGLLNCESGSLTSFQKNRTICTIKYGGRVLNLLLLSYLWFSPSTSDIFYSLVSRPSFMPSIIVPTFISLSFPPNEHPSLVVLCYLYCGGSSSIYIFWIVSIISISNAYLIILAFSG